MQQSASLLSPSFPQSCPLTLSSADSNPSYLPADRDFDRDYEEVLTALGDLNRLSRFLFRGGEGSHQQDLIGLVSTRDDVIEALHQLKDTMDTMFKRFPERFQYI